MSMMFSPLFHAISQSHYLPSDVILDEATAKNPQLVNQEALRKSQALGLAIFEGNAKKTFEALQDGADPNTRANCQALPSLRYDESMLHMASKLGLAEITSHLLAFKANVDTREQQTELTPLHKACIYGNTAVVSTLLGHKANPFLRNQRESDALELAIDNFASPDVPLINRHLKERPRICHILLDHVHYNRHHLSSLLPNAAKNGEEEVVQILLDAKANPNFYEIKPGQVVKTATLAQAIFFPNILQLLLERQADLTATCNRSIYPEGSQPIHIAAYEGRSESVRLLVHAKADPMATNDKSKTPANIAEERLRFLENTQCGIPLQENLRTTLAILAGWGARSPHAFGVPSSTATNVEAQPKQQTQIPVTAITEGNLPTVQTALINGANPNHILPADKAMKTVGQGISLLQAAEKAQ